MGEDSPRLLMLPEDVVADILARLAPRSLAVSRGVCREWRAIVDAWCNLLPISMGGFFIQTNESLAEWEFFVRPSMAHKTVAGDLEHYLRMWNPPYIVDSCNGLLLVSEDHVVNPATRQRVRLPPYPAAINLFRRRYLAFDPSLSPHYKVVSIQGPPYYGKAESEGLEWPPSAYTLLIYSSSTGSWEERQFVRQGPTVTIAARDGFRPFSDLGQSHGVYWNGALYLYWSDFSMRITLSNDDTYQVLPLPASIKTSEFYQPRLERSKNGLHLAVVDDQQQLKVWFLLDEFGGGKQMEWVLKHEANLQAVRLPEYTYRPWILQDGTYNKELVQLEKALDWDSDEDNDDGIGERGETWPCQLVEVFGFHPYREIVFLLLWSSRVVAYYFNSSKMQDLGELQIKHTYEIIESTFTYTPCWVGELPGNNSTN